MNGGNAGENMAGGLYSMKLVLLILSGSKIKNNLTVHSRRTNTAVETQSISQTSIP
jgi:hypothetical protein